MADQKTIQVEYEGQTITVPRPDGVFTKAEIEEGYISRNVVNDQYVLKASMDDRFKNWVHRDKAVEDEAVISSVLEKHGKKSEDIDVDSLRQQIRASEVDPVVKDMNDMVQRLKRAEIREAARKYFDDRFVDPPAPGKPSYIETLIDSQLEYDKALGYSVAVENGTRLPSNNPTTERPYQDASQLLQRLSSTDSFKGLLRPAARNNGSGYQGNSDSNNGAGSRDPSEYKPRSKMDTDEKLKAIKELGREGYEKIPL